MNVRIGYIKRSWYLIDVEAGFELWQGVTNSSYDGTLVPGATATIGFTGTLSASNTPPNSVSCS